MGATTHLGVRSPTGGSGLDEPDADRVAREIHSVAQVELLQQVRAVPVDGLLADVELRGDLLAAVALRDQLQDLALAPAERTGAGRLAGGDALDALAQRRRYPLREHEPRALRGGAARAHEFFVDRRLEHIALRAGLRRLAEVLLVRVHR